MLHCKSYTLSKPPSKLNVQSHSQRYSRFSAAQNNKIQGNWIQQGESERSTIDFEKSLKKNPNVFMVEIFI